METTQHTNHAVSTARGSAEIVADTFRPEDYAADISAMVRADVVKARCADYTLWTVEVPSYATARTNGALFSWVGHR